MMLNQIQLVVQIGLYRRIMDAVETLSHVGDTVDSSHNRKLVSPTVGRKSTTFSEIPLSNRFEVLATNSDVNSDIHSPILLQNQLFGGLYVRMTENCYTVVKEMIGAWQ